MARAVLLACIAAAAALLAWSLFGRDGGQEGAGGGKSQGGSGKGSGEALLGGYPLSQYYLEHDRFLPATDPETVPAADASWLEETDEVFGVVVAGQARAYPVPMISYHHVVNDVIRGIPIAVTY